ncbi:hypothetical protein IQ274_30200 [Nostoc sp. LEGE 12447]|uniref:hypothetical protein n=1 Tax=Nostoc sp. LEGE 12447 TaxID=1828640 RepID=UPI00188412AD|nr:hypothetical protein [Nostoc sp. LEGE 12447]MBE9002365.1 hypothetical protein [Nostoc sp. LEGE 12447]
MNKIRCYLNYGLPTWAEKITHAGKNNSEVGFRASELWSLVYVAVISNHQG